MSIYVCVAVLQPGLQDTRVFDAIGKMFLLKPRDVLQAQLAERIESATQTVAVCSKTLDYLQKQKAENAANLSELTKAIEARA